MESPMDSHRNRPRNDPSRRIVLIGGTTLAAASALSAGALVRMAQAQQPVPAQPPGRLPNVLAIMADDIGWFNVSAYHHGMMGARTPNIDRIAREGAMLIDAYAQASCTAGRAAFITGQIPMRTGLTTVGLPGAPQGLSFEDPTLAELLKPLGYMTAQIGKTISATATSFCRRSTASMSSTATSTISTPRKNRSNRTTRKTIRYFSKSSDRVACWKRKPQRRTTRPQTRGSAASENKPLGTAVP